MNATVRKEDGTPYVVIFSEPPKRKVMKIRSKDFARFVSYAAWKHFDDKKALSSIVRTAAIDLLEAMARFGPNTAVALDLRTARRDGCLWYDLGDGRAVRVWEGKWDLKNGADPLFKRFGHQQVQLEPERGGKLEQVLRFLNVNGEDRRSVRLLLAYVVASLVPDIARPILAVHGPQGSAKSSFLRVIKSLVDPSSMDLLPLPNDQKELAQILSQQYLICFDNLSHLTDAQSDDLCRACTGQAFAKRALYTDDDSIMFKYKRAIGLNGINIIATKPDLLERCIIFELEAISPSGRKQESTLWKEFETEKPKILGAMFDVLSKAMQIREECGVLLEGRRMRLADFAEWGAAVTIALGGTADEFADAYLFNIEQQNEEALESSILAQVVMSFMADLRTYEGSTLELFRELKMHADMSMKIQNDNDFPKNHRALVKKLKIVKTNLLAVGIEYRYLKNERPRRIHITNLKRSDDANDTTPASSEPTPPSPFDGLEPNNY